MIKMGSNGDGPFHHVVSKHKRSVLERIEKFVSEHHFTDSNIFGRIYKVRKDVEEICHFGPTDRFPEDVKKFNFLPTTVGESFGPTFSTHWFKLEFQVPQTWSNEEVHLLWDSGCEAMLWHNDKPVFSFSSTQESGVLKTYCLTKSLTSAQNSYTYLVEMACNRELGEGKDGMINAPDMNKTFGLKQVQLVVVDREAYSAYVDLCVLYDIAKSLPDDSQRGLEAMYAANEIINKLVCGNFSINSYETSKNISAKYFSQSNATSQHIVHAIGHCHIDSAWLWPYAETVRKCARSWISQIGIMKQNPEFKFVCSQAQQFDWVKNHYPNIYQELKTFVKKKQFIPVGGTWVEMDGNVPSGEAMIRQFYYGQKFFRSEFGITCDEFWLPDTFGYSANLPQIMKESEIKYFLTQKLSWSLVNKFPHHTFFWEGIDGTRQLTHFPPGDSYGMAMQAKELLQTMNNHSDKGRSNASMFLFGYGDGGGGPRESMLDRFKRLEDCAGLPRVKMSTPKEFFGEVESDAHNLCTWVGELFLELHNGTYTSQAEIKKQNRRSECLLHDIEFLASLAITFDEKYKHPDCELERLWKLLLLNQFHDVLPGTSIEMVNQDAHKYYKDIAKSGQDLLHNALVNTVNRSKSIGQYCAVNTLSWPRKEVMTINGKLAIVSSPSLGFASVNIETISTCLHPAEITMHDSGNVSMKNGHISCEVDPVGRIRSLCGLYGDQFEECISEGFCANQFVIFDDVPLYWDAWDVMEYHLETRISVEKVSKTLEVCENSPLRVACKFTLTISEKSLITQTISLDADSPVLKFNTEVDWHESHKFLKVEFPLNVRSPRATYEIQFGHIERPTHQNTTWETAKYEVWAHKWCDLSQHNLGVALLNDSKYGCSAFGNLLRLSLLRSPKAPDANADMGQHSFTYALMPHQGTFQSAGVIREAYNLNYPMHITACDPELKQFAFLQLSSEAVIVEACKKSDCHKDSILLRLYEAFGGAANNVEIVFPDFKLKSVKRCNALEDVKEQLRVSETGHSFFISFKPFQIRSILVSLKQI